MRARNSAFGRLFAARRGAGSELPTAVSAGNIYYGIWFPVIVCGAVFALGALLIQETKYRRIRDIGWWR